MFKRVLAVLAVPAVAAFVAMGAAGAASASPMPGTTGPGSWSFDPGTGSNAISTTTGPPMTSTSTVYQAQIQQPINPDDSSVWPAKKGVIPVQFYLQQATKTTTTTTPTTVYPGAITSDPNQGYTNLGLVPAGSFTVNNISNLTADFGWLDGNNQCGSLRWQIDTPDGVIWVYYGDLSSTFQSGQGGSTVNMWTTGEARYEGGGVAPKTFAGTPEYTTLADLLSRTSPAGNVGMEPVTRIALITDSYLCNGSSQHVDLQDATVTIGGETDTYTPGTATGTPVTTSTTGPFTNTTSPSMYIDIAKGTGADPGIVDETTYTGVGDTSGQFAVVDGKYKYNLSNNLSAGTYNVYMTPDTDANRIPVTNSPTGAATFVLK
jgi:hypothetical protein